MSDHDFEKQVKQKMDEWKLRPSDGVWTEVARRVRQRRRRRVGALWLSGLALFMAVTGGYYTWVQNNTSTPPVAVHNDVVPAGAGTAKEQHAVTPGNTSAPNTATASHAETVSSSNTTIHNNNSTSDNTAATVKNKNTSLPKADASVTTEGEKNTTAAASSVSVHIENVTADKHVTKNRNIIRNSAGNSGTLTRNVTVIKRKSNSHISSQPVVLPAITELEAQQTTDQTITSTTGIHEAQNISEPVRYAVPRTDWQIFAPGTIAPDSIDAGNYAEATPLRRDASSSFSRWKWGVKVDAGYSGVVEIKPLSSSDKNSQDMLQASPSVNNGFSLSVSRLTSEPSAVSKGMYFSAGFFVEHWFTPRIAVSSGLQYDYFSTRIAVGQYVDRSTLVTNGSFFNQSIVRGYYVNSFTQIYTNKYSFIGLPISLQWKVNKGNRLPLILNAGAVINRLVNTSTLRFDDNSKVYYGDDQIVRKTQVGLHAGFDVGVLQRSRFPLRVGPTVRYNVSGLSNGTMDAINNHHLWSYGLSVKMLLKK